MLGAAMQVHTLAVDEAVSSLRSGRHGLSSAEARRRLLEYGPNRVARLARRPAWLGLLRQFTQFFSVILWAAAGLAFVAEWNSPGERMARIGYAIIAVILINGVFSFWQEYRVEQTLAALQKLLPRRVRALRDGAMVEVPAEDLVVGDVILVEPGNDVAADCRLVEAFGLKVSNATITGESDPQIRTADPSPADDPVRAGNLLLAGTSVVSGHGKCLVYATGAATEFGKIAHLAQTGGDATAPLTTELARLSRLIAILAVAIGLVFLAIGLIAGLPFWQDFIFAIGIIVAMVPEGLLTTLTLALAMAAKRLAKRNVLIRHLASVETLGSATVICTDKTGTLTENRMRVRELLLGQELLSPAQLAGQPEWVDRYRGFFCGVLLCHNLNEVSGDHGRTLQGDPMELALADLGLRAAAAPITSRRVHEIPFDSDRMRQSVVHDEGGVAVLYTKGAPEAVLPLCAYYVEAGAVRPLTAEARERIRRGQEKMAARGLRILAYAARNLPSGSTPSEWERELVFQGLAGLDDPPRPEVPEAIQRCRQAGIKVIMVTGDHPSTALAIAREIGLVRSASPVVMTGDQLRRLSETELQIALDAPEIIFARVVPGHKTRIVEALKSKGHIVAVTGDGVNDAPALKAAHIGVAMGMTGTDVAKAAADMVLLDDNFASIVNAVEEGRALFQNIRKFLTYILVHNVAELVPYLAFALFAIPLPLTPIQMLVVDMCTDSLTALGLGAEKPNPQAMRLPPRRPSQRLMTITLALRSYLFLGGIEAAAAMAAFFFVLHGGGWSYGERLAADDPLYQRATAACLSAIIVMQIVNVFMCRSSVRSVFTTGLLDNPILVAGVALEITLLVLIDYTAWGNALLETAPVPAEVWIFVAPFAAAMLLLEEARKWLARRRSRRVELDQGRCRPCA
jgi:calcium-translocating P-type ATPase